MASTPEVLWEDQKRINEFGKLNNRHHELSAKLREKKVWNPSFKAPRLCAGGEKEGAHDGGGKNFVAQKLQDDLEDASNELVIAEEPEVRYVMGEVFVHMSSEEAETRMEQYQERTASEVKEIESELEGIRSRMEELKRVLYGKFGNNINLEEELT